MASPLKKGGANDLRNVIFVNGVKSMVGKIVSQIHGFIADEDGATLVEYGVALLIAILVGGIGLTNLAAGTGANMTLAQAALTTE
jgi:Flp pilus assembly pilin Flp